MRGNKVYDPQLCTCMYKLQVLYEQWAEGIQCVGIMNCVSFPPLPLFPIIVWLLFHSRNDECIPYRGRGLVTFRKDKTQLAALNCESFTQHSLEVRKVAD